MKFEIKVAINISSKVQTEPLLENCKVRELLTDGWRGHNGLHTDFVHKVIGHAEKYVDGQTPTNGIENFWSLLKRGIKGIYVSVESYHLFVYLDEQSFRFNTGTGKDALSAYN